MVNNSNEKIKARVHRSGKRELDCKLLESGEMVVARSSANLVKGDNFVVVGDFVELSLDESTGEYSIIKVEERTTEITRIVKRESKSKVTAANCDRLVLVTSVSKPVYKRRVIDRFLIRAFQWGIPAIVVFNKMDQFEEGSIDLKFEEDRLKEIEVDCYELSALFPEYENRFLEKSTEELKQRLAGETSIFLGQSGVGKSKLINLLTDGEFDLRTHEIGKKSGKGAHTTTWSEIIECGDYTFIDSPGIKSFSLDNLTADELLPMFPDVEAVALTCKFKNCNHQEGVKGCGFGKFFEDESYQSDLILSRLDSYLRIYEELAETPGWQKKI